MVSGHGRAAGPGPGVLVDPGTGRTGPWPDDMRAALTGGGAQRTGG